MDLTPEEKQKIYEEEKARLETQGKSAQSDNGSTKTKPSAWAGLVIIIFIVVFAVYSANKDSYEVPEAGIQEGAVKQEEFPGFVKVSGFQNSDGNGGESNEFIVTSKDIKFITTCSAGADACSAELKQVGTSKTHEIFDSPGNTGRFSGEKILSVGPGTFYIEVKSKGRMSEMVILQGDTPASAEEIAASQKMVTLAEDAWKRTKAGTLCAKNPTWTKDDCEKVANGHYWIGMTYEMLVESFGRKPNHANPSNYGSGTQWQWCWTGITPSCFYDRNGDNLIDSYN